MIDKSRFIVVWHIPMNWLRTASIGIIMGLADLVPGVSGGTIAFISGIYEKLIASISHFNGCLLRYLFTGKFKEARVHINGGFILPLLAWVILAIALGSGVMSRAMDTHPLAVQMFFVGMIVMSVIALMREYKLDTWWLVGLFIAGLLAGTVLVQVFEFTLPATLWGLLIAGFFGSMAMILPGISGSYILLILWAYERVIDHVDGFVDGLRAFDRTMMSDHIWPLFAVVGGVVLGLVIMSNILKWMLGKWHNQVILFLLGLMTGALPAIIPSVGAMQANWMLATTWFILGVALVLGFFWWKE